MDENENQNKDFEVVTGDGSELELSEVYDHLIQTSDFKNEEVIDEICLTNFKKFMIYIPMIIWKKLKVHY